MEKYVKDGKVAILVSPGWGAGWSTWDKKELSFDKRVVEKFLQNVSANEMKAYLNTIGYEDVYMGGYHELTIRWLPVGTRYRIIENDGWESIEKRDDIGWETA